MHRLALVAGLVGLASLTGCITPERHREVLAKNKNLQAEKQDLLRVNSEFQARENRLQAEIKRMQPLVQDAAYLEAKKKEVEAILKGLKNGGTDLPPGVSTFESAEGLVLRVEGRVLFASGSATLSTEGQKTLKSLVNGINTHAGAIRVAGHTDTDQIKHSKWKTNMRLSTERALSVLEYLQGMGVPPAKMSATGFGPHQPVDQADKSRNRRVEIILLR